MQSLKLRSIILLADCLLHPVGFDSDFSDMCRPCPKPYECVAQWWQQSVYSAVRPFCKRINGNTNIGSSVVMYMGIPLYGAVCYFLWYPFTKTLFLCAMYKMHSMASFPGAQNSCGCNSDTTFTEGVMIECRFSMSVQHGGGGHPATL